MKAVVKDVIDFKTAAWQSEQAADAYNDGTLAAPLLFQLVRRDQYLHYVTSYAQLGGKILDLGCGTGLISIALHKLGYQVVECDASQSMLYRLSLEVGAESIDLSLGDAFAVPAKDGEFDMVITRMLMQHLPVG